LVRAFVCTWADATHTQRGANFLCAKLETGPWNYLVRLHRRRTVGLLSGLGVRTTSSKQSPVDGFVIGGAHNGSSFVCFSRGDRNRALFVTTQKLRLLLLAVCRVRSQTSPLSFNQIAMKFDLPSGRSRSSEGRKRLYNSTRNMHKRMITGKTN
jgi:hypothetical protein